jgi:hypothetical protein
VKGREGMSEKKGRKEWKERMEWPKRRRIINEYMKEVREKVK